MKTFPLLPAGNVAERFRQAPLSYDLDTVAQLPRLSVERTLVTTDFDEAASRLFSWAAQRSVFRVAATESPLKTGTVVVMRIGLKRLSFGFGCRVVECIREPDRRGFTYGTLPGHIERGEETFLLTRNADGTISFSIVAHSEPATWWLKILRPALDLVRAVLTRTRYLRALD